MAVQYFSRFAIVLGYEIHYTEWLPAAATALAEIAALPVVVMWHGAMRTCRDFDFAAGVMAERGCRVLCPSTLGRGLSAWARTDPVAEYNLRAYAPLAVAWLQGLGVTRVRWVGTSMGGALGIVLAADLLSDVIERLVVNDIGPELNPEAVERIRKYATSLPTFDTVAQLEVFLRKAYAPFGQLTDREWAAMAETFARRLDDGRWALHFDPRLPAAFAVDVADFNLWAEYDRLRCPMLVLRGADSDLLLPRVTAEMEMRGPRCASARHRRSFNLSRARARARTTVLAS